MKNPYEHSWKYFEASTRGHQLTVHHDDGLYRHLYMGIPGSGIWSWSVVTWPGCLAITGDIGSGFVFCRESDMVEFFATSGHGFGDGSPAINPGYWAEKLQEACRGSARVWSEEMFLSAVRDVLSDVEDERYLGKLDEIYEEAEEVSTSEDMALDWAYNHPLDTLGPDFIESGFKDFDAHFLYACWAISMTVNAYRKQRKP